MYSIDLQKRMARFPCPERCAHWIRNEFKRCSFRHETKCRCVLHFQFNITKLRKGETGPQYFFFFKLLIFGLFLLAGWPWVELRNSGHSRPQSRPSLLDGGVLTREKAGRLIIIVFGDCDWLSWSKLFRNSIFFYSRKYALLDLSLSPRSGKPLMVLIVLAIFVCAIQCVWKMK